jgi:predicted GIY-YIG superfamily endonuclease
MSYPAKRCVYIIRSLNDPKKRYIGVTSDLDARVTAHNAGQNRSTAPWKPWDIDVTIAFRTGRMALPLREVPEIRRRSRLCEPPLQRRHSARQQ